MERYDYLKSVYAEINAANEEILVNLSRGIELGPEISDVEHELLGNLATRNWLDGRVASLGSMGISTEGMGMEAEDPDSVKAMIKDLVKRGESGYGIPADLGLFFWSTVHNFSVFQQAKRMDREVEMPLIDLTSLDPEVLQRISMREERGKELGLVPEQVRALWGGTILYQRAALSARKMRLRYGTGALVTLFACLTATAALWAAPAEIDRNQDGVPDRCYALLVGKYGPSARVGTLVMKYAHGIWTAYPPESSNGSCKETKEKDLVSTDKICLSEQEVQISTQRTGSEQQPRRTKMVENCRQFVRRGIGASDK